MKGLTTEQKIALLEEVKPLLCVANYINNQTGNIKMGKKLTAKQKIKLLEEVRSMLIREETNFICIAIEYIMAHKENRFFCNSYNAMARYVPEMLKYKPGKKNMIDGSSPWFHRRDIESRI